MNFVLIGGGGCISAGSAAAASDYDYAPFVNDKTRLRRVSREGRPEALLPSGSSSQTPSARLETMGLRSELISGINRARGECFSDEFVIIVSILRAQRRMGLKYIL